MVIDRKPQKTKYLGGYRPEAEDEWNLFDLQSGGLCHARNLCMYVEYILSIVPVSGDWSRELVIQSQYTGIKCVSSTYVSPEKSYIIC